MIGMVSGMGDLNMTWPRENMRNMRGFGVNSRNGIGSLNVRACIIGRGLATAPGRSGPEQNKHS